MYYYYVLIMYCYMCFLNDVIKHFPLLSKPELPSHNPIRSISCTVLNLLLPIPSLRPPSFDLRLRHKVDQE